MNKETQIHIEKQLHTPRKSSEESVSKSQTCRQRMAGSFCSVLSREKILSLFLTTTNWERERRGKNNMCWQGDIVEQLELLGIPCLIISARFTRCDPASVSRYLLSRQVAEGKHKAPVEVSFSSQRVVVDVCLLSVILQTFQPATEKDWKCLEIFLDIQSGDKREGQVNG